MELKQKQITGVPRNFVSTPNANVLMAFEIQGVLPKIKLTKVLEKVAKKHLLIQAQISIDEQNSAWFNFPKHYDPVIIEHSENNLKEIFIAELKTPLNLDFGPLIRFNLIPNDKNTVLLINSNHMICDGLSMLYLMDDILMNINNPNAAETINPKLTLMDSGNIPIKLDGLIVRLFVNKINKKWAKSDVQLNQNNYLSMVGRFWKNHTPSYINQNFNKELTGRILEKCKSHGITVNSFLATAFIYAEQMLFPINPIRNKYIISVNLRDYLKEHPGNKVGYYVSAIRLKYFYNTKQDFWLNAENFQKKFKLKFKLKNLFQSQIMGLFHPKFVDAIFLNKHKQRNDKSIRKFLKKKKLDSVSSSFTLTNLGVVNFDASKRKGQVQEIWPPTIISDTMQKYISVLTYNGILRIGISSSDRIIPKHEIEVFLNRTIDFISKIILGSED